MMRADHTRSIVVPERVRLRAEQSGPQTRQWLKDLPGLIAVLEQEWELSIGQPLSGESSAYVAPVKTVSGNAVIKIDMPSQHGPYGFEQEIDTLLRANGRGYVRVFKCDDEHRALLLRTARTLHAREENGTEAGNTIAVQDTETRMAPPTECGSNDERFGVQSADLGSAHKRALGQT